MVRIYLHVLAPQQTWSLLLTAGQLLDFRRVLGGGGCESWGAGEGDMLRVCVCQRGREIARE
jgi:hypothetical protein